MERLKRCLQEQGLEPVDIPKGFIIHEIIGLGMAVGFWSACYAVQPSRKFFTPLTRSVTRRPRLERLYSGAMVKAHKTVQSMGWLRHVPGGQDTTRLTVGLAESIALRAVIKPVTFPFKIWASYQIVMLMKQERWQKWQREAISRLPLAGPS